jgi:hypothetical protein
MADKKLYKIRQISTGLYSTGGGFPVFRKSGKSWEIGPLKSHLRLIQQEMKDFTRYAGCELVQYTELIEPATIQLKDLIDPLEHELVIDKLKGI